MKTLYSKFKLLFTLLFLLTLLQSNFAQTITADDNLSDYFIDVNWNLPITPCLLDGVNQYSSVTLRLLKDGGEIEFQTIDGQELIDLYAAGNPLVGTYRDFVGPNLSHNYEIMIFHGTLGSIDLDCSFINDNGQTSDVLVPDQFSTSTDILDKIELAWTNRSDLATSYKLYRDTILIETFTMDIARDSSLNFAEQFLFNSFSSIKSGESYNYSIEMVSGYINQNWTYNLGNGNTIPLNLMATDAPTFPEKVNVTWNALPPASIDKYQVWRDGNLFAIKLPSDISHTDFAPHFGDSIDYNLRVIKDDTVRASFVDYGSVAANGTISGSVFTTEGSFPVENVSVKITRESTGDTLVTLTNNLGEFTFTDVAYGLLDSFEFSAVLPNHTFAYPIPKVGLSSLENNYENAVILDEFTFTQGASSNTVNSFTATPDINNDLVDLNWSLSTSASNFFIDLLRNGEKIYSSTSAGELISSYQDNEGIPGEQETEYSIRIYTIQGNTISSAEEEVIVTYPNVSDLGSLTVAPDGNGNIFLSWESAVGLPNNSTNVDSFRVYRNDTLIVTLDNLMETHTDDTAPFDFDHEYSVTAIINRNNTTYESVNPKLSDPQIINLGPMPTHPFVSTFVNGSNTIPEVSISWQVPATLPNSYNFTGFFVYRNDELIAKIPKRNDLTPPYSQSTIDNQGFGLTNIEYKVSVYRDTRREIIESEKVSANIINFPELILAPNLSASTSTTDSRVVHLSWDPATLGTNNKIDGYYLIYNGVDSIKLSPLDKEYNHFPGLLTNHQYALHRFKIFNGNDVLSNQSSDVQVTLAPVSPTPPVYAPTDVSVTRDLPNQAKICWEYLDFIPSSFEVYEVGVTSTLIATLPEGSRFYYDNNPAVNSSTTYKVRAVQNGLYSDFVGAESSVPRFTLVYGNVQHPSSREGFLNAIVQVESSFGITSSVYTDSSGYYQIYVPSSWISSGTNVNVTARTPNGSTNSPMIPTGEYTSYRVDIFRGKPEPVAKTNQAFVNFAAVDYDRYELKGYLHWSCSDGNYDGVDINRGLDFLGSVAKADGNILVDSSAVPGISYNYVLRAFKNTPTGKKYGDTKTIETQFPELSPVINLTAFPFVESNRVQLQWSHQYNHADGYLITRNNEFLGDVKKDSLFIFSDTTGTAGQSYTYTIRGYKLVNNQIYYSTEENVTATFPSIAKVTNLMATVPDTTVNGYPYNFNHVLLTWDEYPSTSITGYKIFRDSELIVQLAPDSSSYEDYFGIPGAPTEYAVSVLVEQNGSILESEQKITNINFPEVSWLSFDSIEERFDLGDLKISWSYFANGIDGFRILNPQSQTIETILFDSESDGPGNYSIIDRVTKNNVIGEFNVMPFIIRNGIEYNVPGLGGVNSQYPPPPPLTNIIASQATFDNAVEVTWTIPLGANFDQFRLVKTAQSDPSITETIYIDKNQRSYFDLFEDGDLIDTFNYTITSMRTVDGLDFFSNPSTDLGWPGKALNAAGALGSGIKVAIDGNWMVAGEFGQINIYKFENNEWVFKQNFVGTANSFGKDVDISDKLIVASDPVLNGYVIYRLDVNTWVHDLSATGGYGNQVSVAIDNERVVIGGQLSTANTPYDFFYTVLQRMVGAPYNAQAPYLVIPKNLSNDPTNVPELTGASAWYPIRYFDVDIDGDDILLGAPQARIGNTGIPDLYGLVIHSKIINNEVVAQDVIFDQSSIDNNQTDEQFGSEVSFENGKAAISSPRALNSSGIRTGKFKIYELNNMEWAPIQTIFSPTSQLFGEFGNGLNWHNDFLAVAQGVAGQNDARLYLYHEDEFSGEFDISQSPDPASSVYREAFFDSGNPDKYLDGFGVSIGMSDEQIVVGSGNLFVTGPSAIYPFDFFDIQFNNLEASDGTFEDTKISWTLSGCDDCPTDYIDSIRIYRNSELIGLVEPGAVEFFDNPFDLIPGASDPIAGKNYIYEVEAKINSPGGFSSKRFGDTGFAKRQGEVSGDVFVNGTSTGVPAVDITLTGIDAIDNVVYEYSTTTLSDGSFLIQDIYLGASGLTYFIQPTFQDHAFQSAQNDSILLTPNTPAKSNLIFFDNTAYVVSGEVRRANSICPLEGIIVEYKNTINGTESVADTTSTDSEGRYSLVINPSLNNLSEIKITVSNEQVSSSSSAGDSTTIQHQFSPAEKVFTNFVNFPIAQEQNFTDELIYPVRIFVENTCGLPFADQPVELRVASLDGCFEYKDTSSSLGIFNLELAPKNYIFSVTNLIGAGVTNYENSGLNFLQPRPFYLDLAAIHDTVTTDTLPSIDPLTFVYHRLPNFVFTSSFNRFKCDDPTEPAILSQGETHTLDFVVSENHLGQSCNVSEGYIIMRNSGAVQPFDTLFIENGFFPTYTFTAGIPNLVAPYTLLVSAQYFSDQGSLLGDFSFPIIIEGQRQLPGTGIITDALTDEAGDLQLPLLVLRDPPGDGSFSSIASGTSISKSLTFEQESSGSIGLIAEASANFFGAGVFVNASAGIGGGNTSGASQEFSISTSQTFSTSSAENAIGRSANVIVGAGVSGQYGLSQVLTFENNCEPNLKNIIALGLGGFNSTYGYTVEFIEGLIDGYKRDSVEVENNMQSILRNDGTYFTKDEARIRYNTLIESWQQMLHYHDVETVPHYVLCSDFSYRDELSPDAIALYDDWRNGFCGQIGTYAGDNFTMNENIIWTPTLINSYNNAIAFTDTLKGTQLDYVDSGDLGLDQNEITANNLLVTNQFHNALGNGAKSAEVFDLSGNVNFERSITAQQSSSTSTSFSRFFYLDASAGFTAGIKGAVGIGFLQNITDVEGKIGVQIKADAKMSISRAQAEANESTISYTIFDDDPEDQITFLALQAPLQDQTPFFIRLGGLSSCPQEEALTLNQDNDPLFIDDFLIAVEDPATQASTQFPDPVYGIEPGDAAIFQMKFSGQGPTGLTRDAEIFLDPVSNPNGAIVKLGGSNLSLVSPVLPIPAGGSLIQSLTIERPTATPFYNFENIRIGIQPACGGEARFVELDVYFNSPCSNVALTGPFEGKIINRINPNILGDREIIPFELRDYQSDNVLLNAIELQYKRLGVGQDWQFVPGGEISRDSLVSNDAEIALGEDKTYLFEWDITGFYNQYPDGDYQVRAIAQCLTNGQNISNEIGITLARSELLVTGYPEPADGIWTPGDEIFTTYSTDIDCGVLNTTTDIEDYLELIDLTTMMPVPFTHVCQDNKLTLVTDNPMSDYDGHELRAIYKNVENVSGNMAKEVIWDFDVVTLFVDWAQDEVEITLYENEVTTVQTRILNNFSTTTPIGSFALSGSQPWLSLNPNSNIFVPPNGVPIDLNFDATAVPPGSYTTTLQINNIPPGRVPTIVINFEVLETVPSPPIDPTYTDSMNLVLNWSFTDPNQSSTDVQDVIQVFKDGIIRGSGFIQEQGNNYFANIKVFGNADDEDELLDFVIWNADQATAYAALPASTNYNNIPFRANTIRGLSNNPEIIRVEDDIFLYRKRIYVDSTHIGGIQDGTSWATAFSDLQDALADANTADTIWMTAGTYFPSTGNRSTSFDVNESITIHGGFQTGMTALTQRMETDYTILSGNIGLNVINTDNSFHVMNTTVADIWLDQLTFKDGNANGVGALEDRGACLFNTGSILLSNCNMSGGDASTDGALIYNSGSLTIEGGRYSVNPSVSVSSLLNASSGVINISNTVQIVKE